MDTEGTWKFRVSNRLLAMIIVPLVTLLVVSVVWNFHQQRLIEQERLRPLPPNGKKRPVSGRKPHGRRHV